MLPADTFNPGASEQAKAGYSCCSGDGHCYKTGCSLELNIKWFVNLVIGFGWCGQQSIRKGLLELN